MHKQIIYFTILLTLISCSEEKVEPLRIPECVSVGSIINKNDSVSKADLKVYFGRSVNNIDLPISRDDLDYEIDYINNQKALVAISLFVYDSCDCVTLLDQLIHEMITIKESEFQASYKVLLDSIEVLFTKQIEVLEMLEHQLDSLKSQPRHAKLLQDPLQYDLIRKEFMMQEKEYIRLMEVRASMYINMAGYTNEILILDKARQVKKAESVQKVHWECLDLRQLTGYDTRAQSINI